MINASQHATSQKTLLGKSKIPTEEKIENITSLEQLRLINELDEEDKAMVYRLIDTIVTKKKFKDFVATMQ